MARDDDRQGSSARGGFPPAVQVALWLIVVLLAVHATIALLGPDRPAYGQQGVLEAARDTSGVFLVPGQIAKDLWGVYLIDRRSGTLVLYMYDPNSRKLKLQAGRTFIYDRYLQNYNTDDPSPEDVARMIGQAEFIRPPQPETPKPDDSR